jgi:hypothetical protein
MGKIKQPSNKFDGRKDKELVFFVDILNDDRKGRQENLQKNSHNKKILEG